MRRALATIAYACLLPFIASAGTVNLIVNGGFENGGLANWVANATPFQYVAGSCDDGFQALTTAAGCIAGVNPATLHAAYSSTAFPNVQHQTGHWTNTLSQSFVVPQNVTISNALLTWVDSVVYSGSGSYRGVDVAIQIYSGSTLLAGQTILLNPTSGGRIPWTANSLNLTSLLQSHEGQTLTLQVSSIVSFDTRSAPKSAATSVITGFDNIQLMVTTSVPEPPTVLLMAAALMLGVIVRNRNRLTAARAGTRFRPACK